MDGLFWDKVNKEDPVIKGCWEWIGSQCSNGYGQIHFRGKNELAHRLSWEMSNGPIPDDMFILHKCDNPICVRPSHLYVGNYADNMRDRVERNPTSWKLKLGYKMTKLVIDLYDAGIYSRKELAIRYGISISAIAYMVNNQRFRINLRKRKLFYETDTICLSG